MGSGASLPKDAPAKRLNAKQCAEIIDPGRFDAALFNQLKDAEGFVTWEQFSEQWSRLSDKQDNTSPKPRQFLRSAAFCEGKDDNEDEEEGEESEVTLDKELLATKRGELLEIEKDIQTSREAMIAAARACILDGVPEWKEKLDAKTECAAVLSAEIHDMEELAWEPVMKGDTVLFYYNSETGASKQFKCLENNNSTPAVVAARSRTSINLGRTTPSDGGGDGRRPSAQERALWHVLQKRSSVVKQFGGEWRECLDLESGYQYYVHVKTGHSQWEKPEGLDALSVTAEEVNDNEDENEEQDASSTSDGWEAITSPKGDILYYYNYLTGAWTHDCPAAWDRESYAVEQEGAEWSAQEVLSLDRQEADCMKTVQSMIQDLKQILLATRHVEALPVAEAFTTLAVEATPVYEGMFELEPNALVQTLENEYDSLLESLKMRGELGDIKEKLEEKAQIERRRETLVHRASSNSLPALRSRTRTMSIKPKSGRDCLMWALLIKSSSATGKTDSGATLYTHDKTGRVFSFDDNEKCGAFEPNVPGTAVGTAVMTI
jgi:hypothetical protein